VWVNIYERRLSYLFASGIFLLNLPVFVDKQCSSTCDWTVDSRIEEDNGMMLNLPDYIESNFPQISGILRPYTSNCEVNILRLHLEYISFNFYKINQLQLEL
jgi:hypothetical protein